MAVGYPIACADTALAAERPWRWRLVANLAAWLVYVGVAVAITWPVPRSPFDTVPIGCEEVATVPLLNVWTVWWNANRAATGFQSYWDAPIFHPTLETFLFSEAQPTTVLVAPLVWTTGNPVLAYNAYLLCGLVLNGGMCFRLMRRLDASWWSALCAGVLVEAQPFTIWQIGVLQLTVLWPSIWTIDAIWQLTRHPRWPTAVEAGLAFAVTYASCNYWGLFLALLLTLTAWVFFIDRHWWTLTPGISKNRASPQPPDDASEEFSKTVAIGTPPGGISRWLMLATAGGVAALLLAPIILPQLRVSRAHALSREMSMIVGLSGQLTDYTDTPWPQWLNHWEMQESGRTGWSLGPGWLKLMAAFFGAMAGLIFPGRRRWTLFVLMFGLAALLLSFGPKFELWGLCPYRWLWACVPGMKQIRSPFRFAMPVQLAIAWLAMLCVNVLDPRRWPGWRRGNNDVVWTGRLGRKQACFAMLANLPAVAVGACLMLETRPQNVAAITWTACVQTPLWVEFLQDETPPEAVVVCLPFVTGSHVSDYEYTARCMAYGMQFQRRMVNGYSGFFPQPFIDLQNAFRHRPEQVADQLAKLGVTHAVVDATRQPEHQLRAMPYSRSWEWLFRDELDHVDVYRIPSGQ